MELEVFIDVSFQKVNQNICMVKIAACEKEIFNDEKPHI